MGYHLSHGPPFHICELEHQEVMLVLLLQEGHFYKMHSAKFAKPHPAMHARITHTHTHTNKMKEILRQKKEGE